MFASTVFAYQLHELVAEHLFSAILLSLIHICMRVSVSVGLGNRRKSVINRFSVPICRLYPGLFCPFFMASSFMRMNVAPGSVLE